LANDRWDLSGDNAYSVLGVRQDVDDADIAAALGLRQLDRMSFLHQRREEIAHRYSDAFGELDTCFAPRDVGLGVHAWHLYILELNQAALGLGRDDVIERLRLRGIATSVHFMPLHLHPAYRRRFGYRPGQFPTAEAVFERAVSLPIYPAMTDADVDHVIDTVQDVLRAARR